MTALVIDGRIVAARIRSEVASQVSEFTGTTAVVPQLAAVLVGDDPASAVYVRNKQQACQQVGMQSTLHRLPAETSTEQLLGLIARLNSADDVSGILIQLPLPRHINEQTILDAVNPLKDVDCFHPENVGLLVQGRPRFSPCTPHGVQVLIHETGRSLDGEHVVILGRSEIVGKPLAMMLVQKNAHANATVTVCHSRTKDLSEITRTADVLVAAIGQPEFVQSEMVKPGAVVIDVGINRKEGKLVGDVNYPAVAEVASAITPVPGGVGPMTIAMLMQNTLIAARLQAEMKRDLGSKRLQ